MPETYEVPLPTSWFALVTPGAPKSKIYHTTHADEHRTAGAAAAGTVARGGEGAAAAARASFGLGHHR